MENLIPDVIDPVRVGTIALAISFGVNILVQFMKSPVLFKEVMKKVPVKWKGFPTRALLVAGLVGVVTLGSKWALGMSVEEALTVGATGFFMAIANYKVFFEDLFSHKTGEKKEKVEQTL